MRYDVVIVGAGPAGLKAAEVLASAGKKVVVLEKNKIVGPKVCGGGITNRDLQYIPKKIVDKSFDEVIIKIRNKKTKIKIVHPFIYTISREKLGKWMLKQAEKAGAKVLISNKVEKIFKNYVVVKHKKIYFDYLIGADGSSSIVRKFLEIPTKKIGHCINYVTKEKFMDLEMVYNYKKFGGFYAWIFPHKTYTSIGALINYDLKNAYEFRNMFESEFRDIFDVKKAKIESALINYDYRGVEFGNMFLVGDAAGLASGWTGEGIYPALVSSEEVAKNIINKNSGYKKLKRWVKLRKRHEFFVKLVKNRFLRDLIYCLFLTGLKNKKIVKIISKTLNR